MLSAEGLHMTKILYLISQHFLPNISHPNKQPRDQSLPVSQMHHQEKSPQTFAHLMNFSKNVSATFDNHTVLLS